MPATDTPSAIDAISVPIGRIIGAGVEGRDEAHGVSRRTTRRQHQFRRLLQGDRAQEPHLVHAGRARRLSARHLHPDPRHRSRRSCTRSSQRNAGGILGMFDMFSGGALGRMTIFALNIMPYISASIIIQLLTAVSPQLEALKKEGESGRKKLNQYTRYGTVLLAAVQAYGIAVGLEGMRVGRAVGGDRSRAIFFRLVDDDHADRRHRLPDVARRADHRARRRQRHLADHLGRHRRQPAACAGRAPSNSAAPARCRPSSSSSFW